MKAGWMLSVLALAGGMAVAQTADKTIVLKGADVRAQLDKLVGPAQGSGSGGATLGTSGNLQLKLNVRTASGGAEIHAHWDDLFVIVDGAATLETGGTVVDAKTSDGETHGSRLEGATSRELHAGDVVIIPAGTPHRLILAPGAVYKALVGKIHED